MSGNILLGGNAGNTAAKDFGEQDATIKSVRVVKSNFTRKDQRTGAEAPKWDLAVQFQGDDGKTVTCFYGGVYDAGNGDYSFGKNGKARSFIARWSEATGRNPSKLDDLVNSRVRVTPKDTEFGGKISWKLGIIGAAKNAAAPATSNPFPLAAPLAYEQRAQPTIDGKTVFESIPQSFRSYIPTALKTTSVDQIASALVSQGLVKTQDEAVAAVNYAKTL